MNFVFFSGTVMDADDGVCAYSLADPVDALTVAWRDDDMVSSDANTKCTGHCNFGVSLITDYLDEDGGETPEWIATAIAQRGEAKRSPADEAREHRRPVVTRGLRSVLVVSMVPVEREKCADS